MTPERATLCPVCGETNDRGLSRCWLCRSDLIAEGVPDAVPSPPLERSEPHFLGASVALTFALFLVLLGTFVLVPGLGIALSVVLVIPFIRTAAVARRRAAKGAEDAFPRLIGLFLASTVVTFVILTVVCVGAFGTFCLVCIGAASGGREDAGPIVVALVATLAVLAVLAFFLGKWVVARWKRDAGSRAR